MPEYYMTVQRLRKVPEFVELSYEKKVTTFTDKNHKDWTLDEVWSELESQNYSNDSERNKWLKNQFGKFYTFEDVGVVEYKIEDKKGNITFPRDVSTNVKKLRDELLFNTIKNPKRFPRVLDVRRL